MPILPKRPIFDELMKFRLERIFNKEIADRLIKERTLERIGVRGFNESSHKNSLEGTLPLLPPINRKLWEKTIRVGFYIRFLQQLCLLLFSLDIHIYPESSLGSFGGNDHLS